MADTFAMRSFVREACAAVANGTGAGHFADLLDRFWETRRQVQTSLEAERIQPGLARAGELVRKLTGLSIGEA